MSYGDSSEGVAGLAGISGGVPPNPQKPSLRLGLGNHSPETYLLPLRRASPPRAARQPVRAELFFDLNEAIPPQRRAAEMALLDEDRPRGDAAAQGQAAGQQRRGARLDSDS